MGLKKKNLYTAILSMVICCSMVLGGCASAGESENGQGTASEGSVSGEKSGNDAASGDEEETGGQNSSVGEFSMQDVEGQTYTQEMFAEYDLTMVNVFTTWCSPCVNEIPDLQKLYDEMKDRSVNVVGIVLDGIDSFGDVDGEAVENAKMLAEYTGADYPFLIPDKSYLNGRLSGINAVPETFFIDKDGNIVGETYSGSRSFEEWKEIVETELEGETP